MDYAPPVNNSQLSKQLDRVATTRQKFQRGKNLHPDRNLLGKADHKREELLEENLPICLSCFLHIHAFPPSPNVPVVYRPGVIAKVQMPLHGNLVNGLKRIPILCTAEKFT